MSVFAPPHPGEILKEEVLDEMGLSVTDAAELLGVSRKTISKIINGHSPITPEMALRLERHFKPSADMWLRLQNAYDLSRLRADVRKGLIAIKGKALRRDRATQTWRVVDRPMRRGSAKE